MNPNPPNKQKRQSRYSVWWILMFLSSHWRAVNNIDIRNPLQSTHTSRSYLATTMQVLNPKELRQCQSWFPEQTLLHIPVQIRQLLFCNSCIKISPFFNLTCSIAPQSITMPNEWWWRKEDRLQGGWDPHTKSALRGAFTDNNIPHPEYLWICFSMLCLRFAQSHLLLLWPPHTTTSQRSPSAVHWFLQTGRKCSPTVQVLQTHLGKDAFVWICFLHTAHEFVGFTLIYLAS